MKIIELQPLIRKVEPLMRISAVAAIYEEILKDASAAENDFMGRQLCRKVIKMCHAKAWGDRMVPGFEYPKWNTFLKELADIADDCGEAINARARSKI